jgi:hypothetical protein
LCPEALAAITAEPTQFKSGKNRVEVVGEGLHQARTEQWQTRMSMWSAYISAVVPDTSELSHSEFLEPAMRERRPIEWKLSLPQFHLAIRIASLKY